MKQIGDGRLDQASRGGMQQFYRDQTIAAMRVLGTYREEFDPVIEIYADLMDQYQDAMDSFIRSGKQYETETAAGGTKKSGIVGAMENIRKDIITYSDRLGLTPKSLEAMKVESPKQSALVDAMTKLGAMFGDDS